MHLLSLDGISKSHWRAGRHQIVVLDDISFALDGGELAAIFGQRASGKTTLLRIAGGLMAPDRGTVHFEGDDLAAAQPSWTGGLPEHIGWVRRGGPTMGSMEMLDYVALPLLRGTYHAEALRHATAALKRMSAQDLAHAKWHELSDAERTLVRIAHAIVREPKLLLADDPTTSLDLTEREIVSTLLREAAQDHGMAVLMTVPDLPDTLRSHRVMSLSAGRLIQGKQPRAVGGAVVDFRRRADESR
jgi:ABC-type cobalamin/Fe3+-siderophores transport system ATPase subunit